MDTQKLAALSARLSRIELALGRLADDRAAGAELEALKKEVERLKSDSLDYID